MLLKRNLGSSLRGTLVLPVEQDILLLATYLIAGHAVFCVVFTESICYMKRMEVAH